MEFKMRIEKQREEIKRVYGPTNSQAIERNKAENNLLLVEALYNIAIAVHNHRGR